MIKKRYCRENAYFSLEATLIMPLVFMTIFFLIYVGFFYYDNCLLTQDTYRLLIRAGQIKYSSNEEIAQKIKEEDAKWYYDKYVMCEWNNKKILVEYNSISIAQEAALNVSVPLTGNHAGERIWSMDTDVKVTRVRPVETIRFCRKTDSLLRKEMD